MNFYKYVFSQPYLGWLLTGVLWTLIITVLTTIISLAIGIPAGMMRSSHCRPAHLVAGLFITLFRTMPLVPFLLFVVFALPGLVAKLTGLPFPRGMEFYLLIACLSLNNAGHVAEIFRSGLKAIPGSQVDAARVLGLNPWQIFIFVLYPQALRISVPALGNRIVHNMKNSSVAVILPLSVDNMEVTGQASRIAGQTFAWAEPLLFAGVTYVALSLLLSKIIQRYSEYVGRKAPGYADS